MPFRLSRVTRYLPWIPSIFLLGLVAGCAPVTKMAPVDDAAVALEAERQREIALDSLIKKQERLTNLAFPLVVAGADLCGEDTKAHIGATFSNKHVFPEDLQDAAIRLYGLGEPLRAMFVVENSPADKAGLKKGDVLQSVGGKSAPVGDNAAKKLLDQFDSHLRADTPMPFVIVRGEEQLTLNVVPSRACKYPVVLSEQDAVNAFADGNKIVITKGLIRFVENDDELSLVIAHELAHNAMSHIDAKMGNYMLGTIFDVIAAAYGVNTQGGFGKIAAQAYSQEFEEEADYVGLYILARTGRDVDAAATFWRRLAAEHPGSIRQDYSSTHPSTPRRFAAMEATQREIDEKRSSGLALVPTLSDDKAPNVSSGEGQVDAPAAADKATDSKEGDAWWSRLIKGVTKKQTDNSESAE